MDVEEARFRTAIHEAGHTVAASLIRRRIAFVTVERSGDTLGRVVFAERTLIDMADHRQVEREAALHLAGFAAELIYDRQTLPTGCAEEILRAYRLLTAIGRDERGFQRVVWRTTTMLRLALWPCVMTVATELHRRGTLDGLAVRRLVQRELGLRRRWSKLDAFQERTGATDFRWLQRRC